MQLPAKNHGTQENVKICKNCLNVEMAFKNSFMEQFCFLQIL